MGIAIPKTGKVYSQNGNTETPETGIETGIPKMGMS